jgi:hypothetical protein
MPFGTTDRIPAPGTKLRYKVLPSGSWTDYIGATGIPGPDMSAGDIDTTELDPYAGASTTPANDAYVLYKTFIQGWKDAGEIGVEGNFTQAQIADLLVQFNIGAGLRIAIHFRNGYAFVCTAYIKGLGTQAPEGDTLVKMPVTFKLTGTPVVVTHSAANAL